MPNLNTQEQIKERIEKRLDYEKALKSLGWFETDGLWFNNYGASMSYEDAVEFMGFPK